MQVVPKDLNKIFALIIQKNLHKILKFPKKKSFFPTEMLSLKVTADLGLSGLFLHPANSSENTGTLLYYMTAKWYVCE